MRLSDFDKAYDHICLYRKSDPFLESLFRQFRYKGVLSEKQIRAVLNRIERKRNYR